MIPGTIVEYIDKQKVICAMVLEAKNQRLRLLTENNKEVKVSLNRIAFKGSERLDISKGRDKAASNLKTISQKRQSLMESVNVQELWEVLNTEEEWLDIDTMAGLCFPNNSTDDHRSAIFRSFFTDRIYFKFNNDRFMPNTPEKVEAIIHQSQEEARKEKKIETFSQWLKQIIESGHADTDALQKEPDFDEFADTLKLIYLYEKESSKYDIGRKILEKAGVKTMVPLFNALVKLNIWERDENIDLRRLEIPIHFKDPVQEYTVNLVRSVNTSDFEPIRKDYTDLPLITIDGQSTLDFDDALSLEEKPGHNLLGVHIADVGHYVKKGDLIDTEALIRGSSIYLPDLKIPMLPQCLAEDLCSLKEGEIRPAISIMIKLGSGAHILDYEIHPSVISVKNQLTYYDANGLTEENRKMNLLYEIAARFREKRIQDGAVQITLPEINIWLNEDGEIVVNRINRESPGRLLVAETMIMANWLMADYLSKNNVPAVFRSQPLPKNRLIKNGEGSLFQNWMQRKHLSRFVLTTSPEPHSGLGLNAYVTATSPIRKYFDLLTQRQIRSTLGLEEPSSREDVDMTIKSLEHPMKAVSRVQFLRKRYWLLRHLEGRIGEKTRAIILSKRKNTYMGLLPDYMIESEIPVPDGMSLKPEDVVELTIQHANARKDLFAVSMS